jgi:hypothetical protein
MIGFLKKPAQWRRQMICTKLPFSCGFDNNLKQALMMACGQGNNIAAVRQYQEAILVGLLLKEPSLIEEYLLPVIAAYEHRHAPPLMNPFEPVWIGHCCCFDTTSLAGTCSLASQARARMP